MSNISIPRLKDTLIFLGWIGGLICIGGLCWFLSRPLRVELLRQSVNRGWTYTGDSRRLESSVVPQTLKSWQARLGTWYNIGGGNRALIFTLIGDGIFLPCAAIVNPSGRVEEILPLGGNGDKLLSRVSPGIIRLYIRRIEGSS